MFVINVGGRLITFNHQNYDLLPSGFYGRGVVFMDARPTVGSHGSSGEAIATDGLFGNADKCDDQMQIEQEMN